MYRINLPRMGLVYPFVLRLLIALAARHLEYLNEHDRQAERYGAVAEKHFSIALSQVAGQLSQLDRDNCQALYISSILVCFYIFARRPNPGEYLVFSDHGPPLWVPLLRGVQTIINTMGSDRVFSGFLAPMQGDGMPQKVYAATASRLRIPRLDWEDPLRKMKVFISSSTELDNIGDYTAAIDRLEEHFKATYGSGDMGAYQGEAVNQVVFRWLYLLDDNLIQQMQQKQPHALIILSYFALLMTALQVDNCWYIKGWPEHILYGIHDSTEASYRIWLRWPMEQVGLDWRE